MGFERIILALAAIAAIVSIAGTASACAGPTTYWGPGNVCFETYSNGAYYYTTSPYSYSSNYYYYFPNDFRYYYNSNWSYYNSGWYYYNGAVYYQVYDPAIIRAQVQENTLCSDIDIASHPIEMTGGEAGLADFEIQNKGSFTFDITDIKVSEVDSEVYTQGYSFDEFIPENGSGIATIYIEAPEGIESKTTTAYLKVEGYFPSNGKECSFSDISESFQITVSASSSISDSADEGSGTTASFSEASATYSDSGNYYSDSFNTYNIEDSYNTTYNYGETGDDGRGNFEEPVSCSNILSYTKRFFLGENDSRTQYFTVKNGSDNAFYIESIQAFDDSGYFHTSIGKPSKTSINAHGAMNVPVTVESTGDALGEQASGTFTISGVFEDNTYCSDTMIGNSDFLISTAEPEPSSPEGSVTLYYPERIEVPRNGTSFTLTITNTTGKEGYIRLSSDSAVIDPVAVTIPAGRESVNARITVQGIDRNAGWVFFDVFVPEHSFDTKTAKIVKAGMQPYPQPQPNPEPSAPDIEIATKVSPQIDGSYDLNITVDNQSDFAVSGTVNLSVPSDWTVRGENRISLEKFGKRTIKLSLAPKESNNRDINAVVSFRTSSGYVFSEPIVLKANTPAFAAMFVLLGASGFWLGLLLIIIIIALIAYWALEEQKKKSAVSKDAWASK